MNNKRWQDMTKEERLKEVDRRLYAIMNPDFNPKKQLTQTDVEASFNRVKESFNAKPELTGNI